MVNTTVLIVVWVLALRAQRIFWRNRGSRTTGAGRRNHRVRPAGPADHQMRGQEGQERTPAPWRCITGAGHSSARCALSFRLAVAVPDLHLAFIAGTQQILAACLSTRHGLRRRPPAHIEVIVMTTSQRRGRVGSLVRRVLGRSAGAGCDGSPRLLAGQPGRQGTARKYPVQHGLLISWVHWTKGWQTVQYEICSSSHPGLQAGGQVTSGLVATRIPDRWPAVLPPGWAWVRSAEFTSCCRWPQQSAGSHRRTGPGQGHRLMAGLAT